MSAKKKRRRYYVSLYESYPIYEPAEGGYYYEGEHLVDCIIVGSLKRARRIMKREANELGFTSIGKNFSSLRGEYIGESDYIYIETVKGIHEHGWHPYC